MSDASELCQKREQYHTTVVQVPFYIVQSWQIGPLDLYFSQRNWGACSIIALKINRSQFREL